MFNKAELSLMYRAVEQYQKNLSQYQTVTYDECEDILDKIQPSIDRYNQNYVCDH